MARSRKKFHSWGAPQRDRWDLHSFRAPVLSNIDLQHASQLALDLGWLQDLERKVMQQSHESQPDQIEWLQRQVGDALRNYFTDFCWREQAECP